MTFSQEVKLEIIDNKPLRQHYKYSLAYGLFFYSHAFTPEDISIRTRQEEVAETFCWLASSLLGRGSSVKMSILKTAGQPVYRAWLPKAEERDQLLLLLEQERGSLAWYAPENREEVYAFLAGAFLSCGNITDPTRGYHMEYVVKTSTKKQPLEAMLEKAVSGFGETTRRNQLVLYCKEVARIQDLLAMIGASNATLKMVEVEMVKEIRNRANRQTNCETANISKQVNASTEQIVDIRLIMNTYGLDSLPPSQQAAAWLRLQNPELSLSELAERSACKISRSGLHHRLAAVSAKAKEIRAAQRKRKEEPPHE